MELPIWILAISQILVDVFIITLIVLLIALVMLIKNATKFFKDKGGKLLDEANDAVDYVKESWILFVLQKVFAPRKGYKYYKKHKDQYKKVNSETD